MVTQKFIIVKKHPHPFHDDMLEMSLYNYLKKLCNKDFFKTAYEDNLVELHQYWDSLFLWEELEDIIPSDRIYDMHMGIRNYEHLISLSDDDLKEVTDWLSRIVDLIDYKPIEEDPKFLELFT